MMRILFICVAIAVVAEGAPVEQNFLQAAAQSIHEAQAPLMKMQNVENKEIKEMMKVTELSRQQDRSSLQQEESLESKAIKQEEKQQALALDSLSKVSSVIDSFKTAGIQKDLGETGPFEEASLAALAQLKSVKSALKTGTQTSNTEKKIKQMKLETTELENQMQTNLGENPFDRAHYKLDHAQQFSEPSNGASSALAQAAAALASSHQQVPAADDSGASSHQQVPAADDSGASSHQQVPAADTTGKSIRSLSKQVINGEHADLSEVQSLAHKLD
jgi:hypothetical protein